MTKVLPRLILSFKRANELTQGPAVEDYFKAIFALPSRGQQPVSTTALAERLGITAGSASAMLRKLDELGLTSHEPYRGVRLTAQGRLVALEVIRHHRLIELFLTETLQMPWDRVHAEAEVLEHVISEELEALIAAKLGDPTLDPHGDPITGRLGVLAAQRGAHLDLLQQPGQDASQLQLELTAAQRTVLIEGLVGTGHRQLAVHHAAPGAGQRLA